MHKGKYLLSFVQKKNIGFISKILIKPHITLTYTSPTYQLYLNYTLTPIVVRLLFDCCPFVVRLNNGQQTDFKRLSI